MRRPRWMRRRPRWTYRIGDEGGRGPLILRRWRGNVYVALRVGNHWFRYHRGEFFR